MTSKLNRLIRDLDECTNCVMPLTEHRPNVYNELVKFTLHLVREIESDPDYVEDSSSFHHKPIIDSNKNQGTLEEMQKDLDLIDSLMNGTNRRIQRKMTTLKFKTQQAIRESKSQTSNDTLSTSPSSSPLSSQQQDHSLDISNELSIFLSTLANLKDRPHIWNQVIGEVQRLQRELKLGEEKEIQKEEESSASTWIHFLGVTTATTNTTNTKKHEEFDEIQYLKWLPETRRTAGERWQDVERLDEVLDGIPMKSAARKMLDGLKKKCTTEARALQRVEAKLATAS
mmetsp:Transcript_36328/g.51376  ORF Transcript_36328/g.51376 Transcript_36328/m.51376 type:complete len:285 (-) Transcript_36328:140-994(-)|eukprot:CAMPEP_0202458390 /NCGR_PEP_ID=MMETSP1360-20130828/24511_1 /ASSEMBLY_ACC=CAM_ASM_000848 /TAXON_ID=515479 /ORGANISM="Licmophora paradoxa, Strain CCMP2313" /LENGTH=284 /DNA_ID=CAMNT_0049078901 /DNA_START=364 /DNA_END=1218 /DNA_ORIENTATION=+